MPRSNNKTRVDTLKELQIQKALGNDVIMCPRCKDKGIYEERYIYDTDTWPCELCEMGWQCTWCEWKDKFNKCNWRRQSKCDKCTEHKDYIGLERPTVLCDACWKIWFEAPKKPKDLIQNSVG